MPWGCCFHAKVELIEANFINGATSIATITVNSVLVLTYDFDVVAIATVQPVGVLPHGDSLP